MGRDRGSDHRQRSATTRAVSAAALAAAALAAVPAVADVRSDTDSVATQTGTEVPTLAELSTLDSDGLLNGLSPALVAAIERQSSPASRADNISAFAN